MERGTLDGGKRHYAVWRDPHPKPSYLFALVGGNLASFASDFTTMSGSKVDLRIYVEPGKEDRCAWAMDSLKRSMRWDEERFGREYDLDVFNIVAVSDFNMGAMENKGLNIFNDALVLASPETATDSSFMGIERVIAHEYFHNWTGNRITCRDWFQLCLKEGLTVFRDQEFGADERSATVQRISEVRQLKARQFPEDAGPLAHPVRPDRYIEINNFYTATVYQKGAEVVRMIQTLLGREGFRKGMDLYFERHDGQAATVEDFVDLLRGASGRDLKQFMTWYSQAGTPELVCQLKYDAKAKTADLTVTQVLPPTPGEAQEEAAAHAGQARAARRQRAGPGAHAGFRRALGERRDRGAQAHREIPLPRRALPSGGVAAARILRAGEPDHRPHGRGPAIPDGQRQRPLQSLAGGPGLCDARAAARGRGRCSAASRPAQPKAFIDALSLTLANDDLEPGYRAQFLYLPSESDLARVIGQDVDPLAIHKARNALRKAVGTRLHDTFVRRLPAHGGQRALLAGPGAGRPARPAQRGAGLPDEPRAAGGHCPRRSAFPAKPQPDRRDGRPVHAFGAEYARSGRRLSTGSMSAGRTIIWSSTAGLPIRPSRRWPPRWPP